MAVHTVIGVILVVWTALAGRSAAQQQQPAALPSATANETYSYIARAVHRGLQPIISKLESRVESLNNRLTLLDSRVTELTTSILRSRQNEQLEELSSQLTAITARLNSQQSQLSELNAQLNEQKSQQEETAATVNSLIAKLDTIVTQQGHLTQTSQVTTRIDSPQSQLSELNTQLNDCSDLPVDSPSGVYLLLPSGNIKQPPVQAYCDMDTAGGNWTVIQRRDDIKPHQDFYLGWTDYKEGFGNVTKEFWWGLEHLFQLTSSGRRYELRVGLEAFDGIRRYAVYQGFSVSSEVDGYKLSVSDYSGTAGDGLMLSVNVKFSTRDRDQDVDSEYHCAQYYQGAWWYGEGCGWSSLNGRYRDGGIRNPTGIWWWEWRLDESLKKTEMKIRPTY
ncbi:techylectin-5B-like [Amphibalanus amphitrite]|uniref:techylectin-5B-like n=1 Tax=Amphibalanus amphitrite TaxID=1232801 RepID=UPI001C917EA1|nr:techylectin-5B-like [Amphibalanus amphitrite]